MNTAIHKHRPLHQAHIGQGRSHQKIGCDIPPAYLERSHTSNCCQRPFGYSAGLKWYQHYPWCSCSSEVTPLLDQDLRRPITVYRAFFLRNSYRVKSLTTRRKGFYQGYLAAYHSIVQPYVHESTRLPRSRLALCQASSMPSTWLLIRAYMSRLGGEDWGVLISLALKG